MAPSFDPPPTNLFCPEDNNSIMGCDDDVDCDVGVEVRLQDHCYIDQNHGFCGDLLIGFPLQTEECLGLLIERECQHLVDGDYVKKLQSGVLGLVGRREDAVDWIRKVHAYYSFGPLSAYLSINYLDRFISAYKLPQGKAWMMQLLSVACLSLAIKMEETELPLPLDLQVGESTFVFEARTIQRMELLVLSILNWRMQPVTPFNYIDYFLHKINGDNPPSKSSITRSIELILSTVRGIEFLEFRPSEVAAAVAISVSRETQTVDIDNDASCFIHIKKERVVRCFERIQERILIEKPVKNASGPVSSVPQSPIGVLDAACLSYKSDDLTVGSHANSHANSADRKKKLDRLSI